MKKILLASVAALTLLSSCEDISADLNIPVNQEFTYHVVIPEGVHDTTYTETITSAKIEGDVQENIDRIKDLEIDEISYKIHNINDGSVAAEVDFEGSVEMESILASFPFLPISSTETNEGTLESFISDDFTVISSDKLNPAATEFLLNVIKDGGTINATVSATANNKNTQACEFDVTFFVKSNVVAKAL
tara:strand:- start:314744 stop:315313 length:570 start_codon:yes stop_codon:yes gene_type:complete